MAPQKQGPGPRPAGGLGGPAFPLNSFLPSQMPPGVRCSMSFLVTPKASTLKDFKGTQGADLKTRAGCLSSLLSLGKQSLLELFCCQRKEGGEITKAHNSCRPPASTPSAQRSSPKHKNARPVSRTGWDGGWGRVSRGGGDSETQFPRTFLSPAETAACAL